MSYSFALVSERVRFLCRTQDIGSILPMEVRRLRHSIRWGPAGFLFFFFFLCYPNGYDETEAIKPRERPLEMTLNPVARSSFLSLACWN